MQVSDAPAVAHGNHDDPDYDAFLARINARFAANVSGGTAPLFTTDAEDLWTAYLGAMPVESRQYHTCHACRQFVERFGGLVTIGADGATASALWNVDDAPEAYRASVAAMERLARRGKVTGVFLSSEKTWGQPATGIWHHLSVVPPAAMLHRRATLTAGQAMAEKREDFKTVMYALNEFTQPMIEQALTLLRTDSLYRSEKVIGPAQWLYDLHVARAAAHAGARANAVWRAIATAPAGFCHPRSSMVGTLLEDIAAGMDFSEVSRRFASKMHPLQYQRPQAAPAAGAIAAAEKVMAQLGAAGALARRYARVDELQALWKPTEPKSQPAAGGVFGHLQPKGAAAAPPDMKVPPVTMTWEKFQRTVLPTAEQIAYFAAAARATWGVLVTAVNPEAPPILQWDREDARNPVSWYVWHGGSTPGEFGLTGGTWQKVALVTLKPSMWNDPEGKFSHQGKGVVFVIDGAKESRQAGAAIFPECLKADFHGIRSVIEAYSRSATLEGLDQPHACGPLLSHGSEWRDALFRVTTAGRSVDYRLDRWD